jgi:Undecaprenyl-phosphate glucose phosphotransferase
VIGLFALPLFPLGFGRLISRMMGKGHIWFQQVALIGLTDLDELLKIERDLSARGIYVAQKSLVSLAPIDRSRYLSRCREVTLEVQSTLQQLRLDGIWIVAPLNEQRRFDELWAALAQVPLPVVLFPNKATQRTLHFDQIKAGSYYGYEVQRAPLTRSERAIKRLMDISMASFALIALSPVFIFTSIAILIESGRPVFFRQDRKGFGGRPFKILKFRSMRVQENGPDIKQAESSDPRITPLGKVLRRTSIDELPQLINVLKGEMSIVGPRPHAIAHDNFYDRIIATYAFRHHVKPGITGWAQVNGFRGNTAQLALMEGRVEHDIWYINHWSPWLDLRIMIKTALEVLWHDEAY